MGKQTNHWWNLVENLVYELAFPSLNLPNHGPSFGLSDKTLDTLVGWLRRNEKKKKMVD